MIDRVQEEVRAAMRSGDRTRRDALRLVQNALQNAQKEAGGALDAETALAVLRRERKRRSEAAEAYRAAGADERAAGEEAEGRIIDEFLPAELGDEELAAIVDGAIERTGADSPRAMGQVMREAMAAVAGRADGRRVQALVRERLGG